MIDAGRPTPEVPHDAPHDAPHASPSSDAPRAPLETDPAVGARVTRRAGAAALMRLAASLARERRRAEPERDAGRAVCEWARALMGPGAADVHVPALRRTLVGDPRHSAGILAGEPSSAGYCAGPTKVGGMSFLASHALTIVDGEPWRTLRAFNEEVLATGAPHPHAQAFLGHVRAAFHAPVSDQDDVSRAMGRAMVGIVFGDAAAPFSDPGKDARELFDVVASVPKRKLQSRRYAGQRQRYYAMLRERWEAAVADGAPTLLARARGAAPAVDTQVLVEQIPNWMFTFTGSATKLLTRTLALILSRDEVRTRVIDEIASAGPSDDAATVHALPYLNACLLESGRLFPPVALTFHRPGAAVDRDAPELVHWFPLLQRDDALGADVHAFRPQRWLEPSGDPVRAASNLFLRGPRRCPGEDLVLFVCRAALVRLVAELRQAGGGTRLARDPLPISFPHREATFRAGGA